MNGIGGEGERPRPFQVSNSEFQEGRKGDGQHMAMGTRNPNTRRVLSDKDAGMEWILYPRVRYWAKSFTHRV